MEQLAMYMTGLPCPPMPVRLPRIDDKIATSHDLLAGLLVSAMTRGNGKLDEERKRKQVAITRTLLDQCLASKDADEMYAHCQRFTAEYLHAFDDAGVCTPGVCFLSVEDVVKGDPVHAATCSWHAAQDILFVENPEMRHKADFYAKMSYEQLVKLHWQRVRDAPMMTELPPCD
jgi:hypothetical protein